MGAQSSQLAQASIVDIEKKDDKLMFKRVDDTVVSIPIDTNSITQTYVDTKGELYIKRTDGKTDGPFKIKSEVKGDVGPTGKDGDGIKNVNVTPEGLLTLENTSGIKYGPFNLKPDGI